MIVLVKTSPRHQKRNKNETAEKHNRRLVSPIN